MDTLKRAWSVTWLHLLCLASKVIWWFKVNRLGGIVLSPWAEVQGTVVQMRYNKTDGDFTFDVVPDIGWENVLSFMGRRTSANSNSAIHCEIMPCDRMLDKDLQAQCDFLAAHANQGVRVKVYGTWFFDGCHLPGWKTVTYKDIIAAFVTGRSPNYADGWTEIHPVKVIKVI